MKVICVMPTRPSPSTNRSPLTESDIRAVTVGELTPLNGQVLIADYDPRWPFLFALEATKLRTALGSRALQIEHTGSTAVPDLPAKPIIDILLVVADSADESAYESMLAEAGYVLRIREPGWHQHRMFNAVDAAVNLHVFSSDCPEIDRILLFRDWLHRNAADRQVYARTKIELAARTWQFIQNYANAKAHVIDTILTRALAGNKL
jgi:GrpB-like predicted nucleotidyltransferase (UPF0157 family)